MDNIGQIFAGGTILIVVMAFISFFFGEKNSGDSIRITGTGRGIDVVNKMIGDKNE